ncbi:hypothetical protein GCM10027414_07000 [Humibacter ginsengiterrae]
MSQSETQYAEPVVLDPETSPLLAVQAVGRLGRCVEIRQLDATIVLTPTEIEALAALVNA